MKVGKEEKDGIEKLVLFVYYSGLGAMDAKGDTNIECTDD